MTVNTDTAASLINPLDLDVDTSLTPTSGDDIDMPFGLGGMLSQRVSQSQFKELAGAGGGWGTGTDGGTTGTDGGTWNPGGFTSTAAGNGRRQQVIEYAKKFLGTPYVWGGTTPNGFDCSGLVQYVYKKFGVNLPRVSQQQANAGKRTSLNNLELGDLVLFNHGKNGPGHVAFWLGNGQVLEAPRTGLNVRIRKLGKGESVFGVHLNV